GEHDGDEEEAPPARAPEQVDDRQRVRDGFNEEGEEEEPQAVERVPPQPAGKQGLLERDDLTLPTRAPLQPALELGLRDPGGEGERAHCRLRAATRERNPHSPRSLRYGTCRNARTSWLRRVSAATTTRATQ